jgi:hypothetical protein
LPATSATLTSQQAPDPISKDILSRQFRRLHEGPLQATDANRQIHRNFTPLIEQNFAQRDARAMTTLVDTLSDAELSDLAQLYVNAATDFGLPQKLPYVMASRLSARRLSRLARHFGFSQVYEAVVFAAPSKAQEYLSLTSTEFNGPQPGEMRFGSDGRYFPPLARPALYRSSDSVHRWDSASGMPVGRAAIRRTGFGQFLHYTPYEVYLSFRTAPVGALGVSGALWETAGVLSGTLLKSFGTGYAIGTTVVKPLVETYAPSLYIAIGDSIGSLVDSMSNAWSGTTQKIADTQRSTAPVFQSTAPQLSSFVDFGGDFGASAEWCTVYNPSFGGGSCWTCPDYNPH